MTPNEIFSMIKNKKDYGETVPPILVLKNY